MICERRLPLEGVCNIRDLGGYPIKGGGHTKFRVFVRSARPCHMTQADKDYLQNYGVTRSLDFRSETEAGKWPSDLMGLDWVEYSLKTMNVRHVIISEETVKAANGEAERMSWPDVYRLMVEDFKPWFRDVLETAADCEGVLHFNCTTGKDRTGVLSAILLGLAGVYDEDIIADYCVSQVYVRPVFEELIASSILWASELSLDNVFFKTHPGNMEALLEHFRREYGGIRQYVLSTGVSEETIGRITAKFAGK